MRLSRVGIVPIEQVALANGFKPREPRRNVLIQARMRCDGARLDVCIRNISSRGMLLLAAAPPPRGTYVEIFIGSATVVGRVVWCKEHRCGIHSQTGIDVDALVGGSRFRGAQSAPSVPRPRCDSPRPSPARSAQQLERSRHWALAFEFGCLVACGAAAAVVVGGTVWELLSSPVQSISQNLPRQA